MFRRTAALCVVPVAVVGANGDYVLTPLSEGVSERMVNPGESFSLQVHLSSDAGDEHNSAIFQVEFSTPGLVYNAYTWSSPYENLTIFDDSTPHFSMLPMALTEDALIGPAHPVGGIDIELSNVIPMGVFTEGVLIDLEFEVPFGFTESEVLISITPDTLADGFTEISSGSHDTFLVIVPAPGVGTMVFASIALCSSRRRRRSGMFQHTIR